MMVIKFSEGMKLFGDAVRSAADEVFRREDLGKAPCKETTDGEHDWRRRPSLWDRTRYFDQCQRCKATRD